MNRSKFSLNAFILIVIIFSAVLFFCTMTVSEMADLRVINERYPIDGTDLAVRYSSSRENGIYSGLENTDTLVLAGDYGHDWGLVRVGDMLYTNEYRASSLGLIYCDCLRIDLGSFEKQLLGRNAVLRGRREDGQLVMVGRAFMPSVYPATNPLCRLYAMTDDTLDPSEEGAALCVYDPQEGVISSFEWITDAEANGFNEKYLGAGEEAAE